jgi:hypothetical protein
MSTGVWVPLVTAAAGLIAGVAAGLASTVLARRWATADRLAAWQREDRLRWHADRLQTYARLISALEAWNQELKRLVGWWHAPEPFDTAEWDRHERAVNELVALVELTAPEGVRNLARGCYREFIETGYNMMLAGDPANYPANSSEREELAQNDINRLMEAMRADLSLGGDGLPAAGTVPRPAG